MQYEQTVRSSLPVININHNQNLKKLNPMVSDLKNESAFSELSNRNHGYFVDKKSCILALHNILLQLRRYTRRVEALSILYCEPIVISINYYHTE